MRPFATLAGVALALLCALGANVRSTDFHVTAAGTCDVADASNDSEELAFLAIINDYRAQNGLTQLSLNPALNRAAQWMVEDMISHNSFGHIDSLGRHPFVRTVDCGYPIAGGENLAAGTNRSGAGGAFELFRNSPSHNANMLGAEYRQIGIARAYGAGTTYGWYWATTFGTAGAPAAPAPAAQQAQPAQQAASPPPPAQPTPEPTPEPAPTSIHLVPGTQLVTWPGAEVALETLLAPAEEHVVAVWTIDPDSGEWMFYVPGLPSFLDTLHTLSTGEAAWVVADAEVDLPLP